jgi:energy-coupling factor transporter ATP-binding protein EcfA2
MPRKPQHANRDEEPNAAERRAVAKQEIAAAPEGLHIVEMFVENVKRVRLAHIKPKGKMLVIAGANGSGKSSIIDAIMWALAGTSTVPSQPIRSGTRVATVKLDIGEYIVTRTFTRIDADKSAKGSTYKTTLHVEGKRREEFKSPQMVLNGIMGKISFDPLAFTRMDDKQQLETMRSLVHFDIDIDALDLAQTLDYDERRIAGRGVDQAKAQLASLNLPAPGLPDEPIDTAAITAKLQNAAQQNQHVAEQRRRKEGLERDAEAAEVQAKQMRRQAAELLDAAEKLDGQVGGISLVSSDPSTSTSRVLELLRDAHQIQVGEEIDTAEVAAELTRAQETNAAIQRAARYRETVQLVAEAEKHWKDIDDRMKTRANERSDAITRAKMPIEGLSIGAGEVVYKGLPFSQASNAEQIRVSVALGVSSNPKLRLGFIKDGSLLDKKSLLLLEKLAEEQNFQIIIERVDPTGKVGVVMEEGEASGEDVVEEAKKA